MSGAWILKIFKESNPNDWEKNSSLHLLHALENALPSRIPHPGNISHWLSVNVDTTVDESGTRSVIPGKAVNPNRSPEITRYIAGLPVNTFHSLLNALKSLDPRDLDWFTTGLYATIDNLNSARLTPDQQREVVSAYLNIATSKPVSAENLALLATSFLNMRPSNEQTCEFRKAVVSAMADHSDNKSSVMRDIQTLKLFGMSVDEIEHARQLSLSILVTPDTTSSIPSYFAANTLCSLPLTEIQRDESCDRILSAIQNEPPDYVSFTSLTHTLIRLQAGVDRLDSAKARVVGLLKNEKYSSVSLSSLVEALISLQPSSREASIAWDKCLSMLMSADIVSTIAFSLATTMSKLHIEDLRTPSTCDRILNYLQKILGTPAGEQSADSLLNIFVHLTPDITQMEAARRVILSYLNTTNISLSLALSLEDYLWELQASDDEILSAKTAILSNIRCVKLDPGEVRLLASRMLDHLSPSDLDERHNLLNSLDPTLTPGPFPFYDSDLQAIRLLSTTVEWIDFLGRWNRI